MVPGERFSPGTSHFKERKMTECIELIDGHYLYLVNYNRIINSQIKDLCLSTGAAAQQRVTVAEAHVDEDTVRKKIKTLSQLIFEVTQNCNLRCKYCVYNGHYNQQRQLSARNMDIETARRGMDYVFSLVKDRKKREFGLSFYGGEPLINIETISWIVEYAQRCFKGWRLLFNLTSNLTLLDDEILDFLIRHNVSLLVSLDGDRHNHDAKRVFADGGGTHRSVLRNLKKIRQRNRDYFDNKVGFISVYSLDLPLGRLYRFFTAPSFVKYKRTNFNIVNKYNTTYYDNYPPDQQAYGREIKAIHRRMLGKVRQGEELSGFESNLYNRLKDTCRPLRYRSHTTLASTCLFNSRLLLDVTGRFHACERVNHNFPLGDVVRGLDFTRMARMAREFTGAVKRDCSRCDIRFLCSRCFVSFGGDGRFGADPEFCRDQRNAIIYGLEKFIKAKEEGLIR